MNGISWLIYLADVADDLNNICGTSLAIGVIGLGVLTLSKGIAKAVTIGIYDDEPQVIPSPIKTAKAIWIPMLVIAIVGAIVPSKDTVYAIAASEIGERVIQSETAGKAVQALNAWLDRQIAPVSK